MGKQQEHRVCSASPGSHSAEGHEIILPGFISIESKPSFPLPSIKRFAESSREEKVISQKVVREPEGHINGHISVTIVFALE